ncbi:unnamed protein product [Thlaspi arvense]|uniref:Uncharacterized protein n=1 Tax=Thlaspi arvense TaxID=13288 RepID=A0AAU9RRV7_THLAR|nr:unnamed protein product [Thlaspi arvense]
MTTKLNLLLTILLLTLTFSQSRPTRPEPLSDQLKKNSKGNSNKNDKGYGSPGGHFELGPGCSVGIGNGGSYAVASGCNLPGSGPGGSYAVTSGEYRKGSVVRPSLVCKEKGHCYKKKLTCPAKCFTSFNISGSGFGGGGGGGGCSFDCKKCEVNCF